MTPVSSMLRLTDPRVAQMAPNAASLYRRASRMYTTIAPTWRGAAREHKVGSQQTMRMWEKGGVVKGGGGARTPRGHRVRCSLRSL